MTGRISIRRPAVILLVAALLPWLAGTAASDDEPEESGSSWHWTPDEWTLTQTSHDTKGYAERPDQRTLDSIAVKWLRIELDPLGNFATVRGRLSAAGRRDRPVDWLQGITVYMGKVPDAKPDWSKGMNQVDTVHSTTVVRRSGELQLRFDLRETRQDRARAREFQFGLALARHTGAKHQTIVWNSRAPTIPGSTSLLTVPAAPEISREIALINRASGWPFSNPDGTHLIRAVNALQRVGKDKALAELEKYLELVGQEFYDDEQDIVFWIVRLLFEQVQPNQRLWPPAIAIFLDDRDSAQNDKWPLNPIALLADVPFMLGHRIGMGGMPEHPKSNLKWARGSATFRKSPLLPTDNPVVVAEEMFRNPKFLALSEHSRKEAISIVRVQATAMAGLAKRDETETSWLIDDSTWEATVAEASRVNIAWDADREQFTKDGR